MHESDLNKVVFHSKEDMAGGHYLQKGEHILRADIKSDYVDINEVLELYNLKKYIDNDLFLNSWTQEDIANFKLKATEYGKVIGKFMATIDDNNVVNSYGNTLRNYVHSFWELVNNQSVFKRISKLNFTNILASEPYIIYEILTHKGLVDYYSTEIKNFLLTYRHEFMYGFNPLDPEDYGTLPAASTLGLLCLICLLFTCCCYRKHLLRQK